MKQLIVTADDFGLALPVNEAIERAHRDGILRAASLMVSAPATDDAIERARNLASLHVGLHVVLVNGKPTLPAASVPDLVDANGEFETDVFRAGVKFFFNTRARAQLESEIRAQFEAFAQTGLPLDHVNAQNHMHVHPTVLAAIVRVGRGYGLRAVRVPHEPFWASWRAVRSHALARAANDVLLRPWMTIMRAQLRRNNIVCNDTVFGMNDSGHVTADKVRAFLPLMPAGVCELYVHPATHTWPQAFPPDYDFAGELQAMIDPAVGRMIEDLRITTTTYTELVLAH